MTSKELNEYHSIKEFSKGTKYDIVKAPQNMMRVVDYKIGHIGNEEIKVLISIRPKWISKILNGEKTIEVRKKVLKEMITDA